MAKTIFLSDNFVTASTISATTGTVNAQFPLSNINLNATTSVARLTSGTNKAIIVLDLGSSKTLDVVSVVGSNLTGFGYTTAKLKLSATSDFSSATSIAIDLNTTYGFGFANFTEISARFAQIEFDSSSSSIEISKIFLGKRIEIIASYSLDSFNREILRNDEIIRNQIGNRFTNILNSQAILSGTFPLLERNNFLILEKIFIEHGNYKPIWVLLDPDNQLFTDGQFKMSMYSYIDNTFSHGLFGGGYINLQLDLIQAV